MKTFRFRKKDRIYKKRDFEHMRNVGVRGASRYFVIVFSKGEKKRLGIVVSKEVGISVTRNRIKRCVREFFRQNKEIFPLGDIVVIVRQAAGSLENVQLREKLQEALKHEAFIDKAH